MEGKRHMHMKRENERENKKKTTKHTHKTIEHTNAKSV